MWSAFLDRLIECIPHKAHNREWKDPHGPSRLQILPSFLFEESHYLSQFDELEFEEGDAFDHYIKVGIPARKLPNPWFDPEYYSAQFADDPGAQSNPLLHYLQKGAKRNVKTCKGQPDLVVPENGLTPLGEFIRSERWKDSSLDPGKCYHQILPEVRKELAQLNVVLVLENRSLLFEDGRYLFILAEFAHELGCHIHVRQTEVFQNSFSRHRFHKEIMDWLKPKELKVSANYPENCVVLADHERPVEGADEVNKWVYLKRSRLNKDCNAIWFKPTMHPSRYQYGTHRLLHSCRRAKRNCKILFSGNSGILYHNPVLRMHFGKLSRNSMIRILKKHFSDRITNLEEQETSSQAMPEGEIVLGLQRQVRIPGLYWLQWLSRANFFICMPGAYFPMTHSLAESMAVGTIPILEYPEIIDPKLEDGVNCVAFHGKSGFLDAIQRVLIMDNEEVQRMQKNVTEFYDKHLNFAPFMANILTGKKPDLHLCFQFEYPFS